MARVMMVTVTVVLRTLTAMKVRSSAEANKRGSQPSSPAAL